MHWIEDLLIVRDTQELMHQTHAFDLKECSVSEWDYSCRWRIVCRLMSSNWRFNDGVYQELGNEVDQGLWLYQRCLLILKWFMNN